MAKFYVQCGQLNVIVEAMDSQAAAMHLIDSAMEPHLWIYDDAGLSDSDRYAHVAIEALLSLSAEVTVSERGFHRSDAERFGTPEILSVWHQTLTGLNRLLRSAGLPPKPLRGSLRSNIALAS